jgi:large subunit ribosomal protein L9
MEVAVAAGEKGRLFGSVTSSAVVDYLASQGVEVERKKVELPEGGIKMVGDHSVKIKLYGGEEALLKVTVSASGEKPEVIEAPKTPKAVVEAEAGIEDDDDAEEDAGESAESDRIEDNTEEEAETEIEE